MLVNWFIVLIEATENLNDSLSLWNHWTEVVWKGSLKKRFTDSF